MKLRFHIPDAFSRRALEGARRLGEEARSERARHLITLLLAMTLAAAATHWTLVLTARRTPPEPVHAVATGNSVALTQPAELAPVMRLFGVQAEATAGNVRLLGVIAVGPSGRGIALVSVDGRPARAQRAGESLAPGVTLVEVRSDHVLLDRAGTPQEVRVPPKSATPATPAAAIPGRPAFGSAVASDRAAPAPAAPANGEGIEVAPAAPFAAPGAREPAVRRLRGRTGS